jgi:flagellar hook-associated protein 3 FlgL
MRITQNMLVDRSIGGIQTSGSRLAQLQEQATSGKRINRPSDAPSDAAQAMKLRSSITSLEQYGRNADDGIARLGLADSTMGEVTTLIQRARDLGLQGANSGAMSQSARNALATELDSIKAALIDQANVSYLGRPVFGGITAGTQAYDATGTYVGTDGAITRKVDEGQRVRVDVPGTSVFGSGASSVFAEVDALATALRSGDDAAVRAGLTALDTRRETVSDARSLAGTAQQRLEKAQSALLDKKLSLTSSLTSVEDIDLPSTLIELNLQEVAYKTALSAAGRAIQPSLSDFLR